jgi:hypothetical protein
MLPRAPVVKVDSYFIGHVRGIRTRRIYTEDVEDVPAYTLTCISETKWVSFAATVSSC